MSAGRILLAFFVLAFLAQPSEAASPSNSSLFAQAAGDSIRIASEETEAESADTLVTGQGFDSPTWVMARSLVIPGWGQAKNSAWGKAILAGSIGAAMYERLYFENRLVGEYKDRARAAAGDETRQSFWERKVERHRDHRRDFIWWTAIFLLLAGGDAYVDAHLKAFDVRIQVAPEETSPDEARRPAVPAVRVGLVWSR